VAISLYEVSHMAIQKLFPIQAVSALISRSRASIYADIKKGVFPPPVKVGARSSRWREKDITEWMDNLHTAKIANK
jgi:prophage regulatory protein